MVKKKPSASSRHAQQTTVSAESIFSRPPSKKTEGALGPKPQASGDDGGVDYSDIPALTEEQLAGFSHQS